MRVFDGHNDAITRGNWAGLVEGRPDGDLDLPRARAGGLGGGVFAVWTPSAGPSTFGTTTLPEPVTHADAAAACAAAAGRLLGFERAGALRVARRAADLDGAAADDAFVAVLGMEGAEAIDPALDALDQWYAAGLRVLGPVWSRRNAFACGVPFAFPSSPDTGPGLTADGGRLVRRCHELGIAVDLSHLNEAGFWDVARIDGAPLVASHSACHALAPSARNLTDAQLRTIAASGGLVGVVFAVGFIRPDGAAERDTPLSVLAGHVRHVVEVTGSVEHVALGSDFDGAPMPDGLRDCSRLPDLLDALRAAGFGEEELEAICWGNWRRVLGACWA